MTSMDLELKKAFTEMQMNKIETTKKIKMIEMQYDVLKTSKVKYILTEQGVKELDTNTRVYGSCGRMFVLSNVPKMLDELKQKQDTCEKLMEQLNDKKDYIVRNLKEQETSLRELVQQKKDAETK